MTSPGLEVIKGVLELVHWLRLLHIVRQTVPPVHHSLTEEVLLKLLATVCWWNNIEVPPCFSTSGGSNYLNAIEKCKWLPEHLKEVFQQQAQRKSNDDKTYTQPGDIANGLNNTFINKVKVSADPETDLRDRLRNFLDKREEDIPLFEIKKD